MKEGIANEKFGIAVDIGTTTIVAALVAKSGDTIAERSCTNSGARYGTDVMSRIRAASEGHAEELRALLCADITTLTEELLRPIFGEAESVCAIREMVLAGNTTMLHLLNGYDCAGLGRHPYTPVSLEREERTAGELFPKLPVGIRDARATLLPGISAFVGADIVAGLYALETMGAFVGETTLFLDLGTNGEMALIRGMISGFEQEKHAQTGQTDVSSLEIAVCSTAAGPVFEGAGIRCGMRGEAGAIAEVVLTPGAAAKSPTTHIRTIGNAPPVGICGSGVLEAVSELARLRLIDKDGLLKEPWFSDGFPLAAGTNDTEIRLYQEDIRAVQLAKAAIRAGAETLPLACGVSARSMDAVLVAGAFGRALNFSRLAPLGMFSPPLLGKCRAVGNTSLAGAGRVLLAVLRGEEERAFAALERIVGSAREVPLAGRQDFEACYLGMMGF